MNKHNLICSFCSPDRIFKMLLLLSFLMLAGAGEVMAGSSARVSLAQKMSGNAEDDREQGHDSSAPEGTGGKGATQGAKQGQVAEQYKKNRLLLVSIDGLRADIVHQAQKYGVNLPFLQSFIKEGTFAQKVVGVFPSLTYPAHTTLLTGTSPQNHGIHGNITFSPELNNPDEWYWFYSSIKADNLWAKAQRYGLNTANVSWPVSVGAPVTYNIPEYFRYFSKRDDELVRMLSTPQGLIQEVENKAFSVPTNFSSQWTLEADKIRLGAVKYLLKTKRPHFTTLYLGAYDSLAHQRGYLDKKALAVLEYYDQALQRIFEQEERPDKGSSEKKGERKSLTLVVVSDHGFADVSRTLNINALFQKNGLIVVDPKNPEQITSYRAYAWEGHGSSGIKLQEPDNAALRQQVSKLLEGLVREGKLAKIYDPLVTEGKDSLELGRGNFGQASFVVEAPLGTMINERPLVGLVTGAPPKYKSTHGYHPTREAMQASFFAKGGEVTAGVDLGVVEMAHIAPLLAKWMGFSFNDNTKK